MIRSVGLRWRWRPPISAWGRRFGIILLIAGTTPVLGSAWIQGKATVAQWLIRHSWSVATAGQEAVTPWPGADHRVVARLQIPALDADYFVLDQDSGAALAFGPGLSRRMSGTSATGADASDVRVISGHRDTHFRFLPQLEPGMVIRFQGVNDRGGRSYTVDRSVVVDSRNGLLPLPAAGGLVLITCYPFDSAVPGGPLRFVVIASHRPPSMTL